MFNKMLDIKRSMPTVMLAVVPFCGFWSLQVRFHPTTFGSSTDYDHDTSMFASIMRLVGHKTRAS
jgi:hypothetical protein